MDVTLQAAWVFPGGSPPLPQCRVVLQNGVIQAVGADVPVEGRLIELPQQALLPQLVNAHTHLEFSRLTQPLEPRNDFAAWIQAVVAWRRSQQGPVVTAIATGCQESAAAGVGLLGEIATTDWIASEPLSRNPALPKLVVFRELLGLRPEQIEPQLEIARQHLATRGHRGVTLGLSPHAPYSVHPNLFRRLIDLTLATLPVPLVTMHLAETPAELELLAQGTGPLADMLRQFGVWTGSEIPRGTRPLDYLRELSRLPNALVIHGNYLDDEELDFLAHHSQLSVVYCPRTHAAMGHAPHRWREMLGRGINLCVGTDSRASNPDLSLWEELRLLQQLAPDLAAAEILKLGTINGAQALGQPDWGIHVGLPPRFVTINLSPAVIQDPQAHLFRVPALPQPFLFSTE